MVFPYPYSMITREEAFELVKGKVKNKNLRKHMLATEACTRALAPRFGGDPNIWGLAGLLHDVAYEEAEAAGDMMLHGDWGAKIAEEHGLPQDAVQAIRAHLGDVPRVTNFDKALYAVDPLTGLIVAAALMHPEKLAGIQAKSVLKRFKDKRFAAGADRGQIQTCSELGMELTEFVSISLEAMRGIRDELGL